MKYVIGAGNWLLLQRMKHAQLVGHIAFLRICKTEGFIPNGLRCPDVLSTTVGCDASMKLAERSSFQVLNLAIQIYYGRLRTMGLQNFRGPLLECDEEYLTKFRILDINRKVKKLSQLQLRYGGFCGHHEVKVDGFRNLTSNSFTGEQLKVLKRGPNYAPIMKISKNDQIVLEAQVDSALARLSNGNVQENKVNAFRGTVKRIINDFVSRPESVSDSSERRIIRDLRDTDIIFAKTDKSKRIVAINNNQYQEMVDEHRNSLIKTRPVLPKTSQQKFNSNLSNIIGKYKDTQIAGVLKRKLCSEPLPSEMRCLPKDHKNDAILRGRPIVAAVDAPSTKLSKYLAAVLNSLISNHVSAHISSTDGFLEIIRDFVLTESMEFASLDVVNLYGSIPVEDHTFPGAVSVVSTFFENYKDECELNTVSKIDFSNLLRLCLTSDTIKIHNEHYKQVNGIQMGNNISCSCAIIFMDFIERQIQAELCDKVVLWKRYIDDIFIVYKNISVSELMSCCNEIHSNITFTLESPTDGKLPYLDLLLRRPTDKNNCKLISSLYYKPCHSNAVIPWDSHHPRYMKINIFKNELRRAIRNGSGIAQQQEGMEGIASRYRANGYPSSVIRRATRSLQSNSVSRPERADTEKVFISLPFMNDNAVREIRRTIQKCNLTDHVCVSFKSNTLSSLLNKKKQSSCECNFCRINTGKGNCFSKNVVYMIKCLLCESFYIGETSRTMRSRLREHLGVSTSNVFEHLSKKHNVNPDTHHITWSILHFHVSNYDVRRRVETSEIRSRRPAINSQHASIHFS